MHIIDPYRHGVGGITGVYWSGPLVTSCYDEKNTGHRNQIYFGGLPIEGWNQNNSNYDYDFYPNYNWIDSAGVTRQQTAPDGVSVYYDYRADSNGDSEPLQKCYLTGSYCDLENCVDEFIDSPNNEGLPTDSGNYWASLQLNTAGSGGAATSESFIAMTQASPWLYRYFFVQFRMRIVDDASGAEMASDWSGKLHTNVEKQILHYEDEGWNHPTGDTGSTIICPRTYVVVTGNCSPNPAEDCYIINDTQDSLISATVDTWVVFSFNTSTTPTYHCGQIISGYASDQMWLGYPDSDIFFEVGPDSTTTCSDCQYSLP